MTKKIISALLAVVIVILLAPCVFASNLQLFDYAELLTNAEEQNLNSEISQIIEKTNVGVAVVTVTSLDGKSVTRYADEFFIENDIGIGENEDGVLLLIDMGSRQWHITTSGYCITALTDYGLEYLEAQFIDYLSNGEYYKAFSAFANSAFELIVSAQNGDIYDYDYGYNHNGNSQELSFGTTLVIGFGVGFVIALIVVSVMKSKLKTVAFKRNASNYLKAGSFNLTGRSDIFLYKNVTKVAIPQNNGGSITHRTGGRSFGGRSGRF